MVDAEYGIVPVPKYDKAQEHYRTWTHDSGSTLSVTSAVPAEDAETVGQIYTVYAILSYQYLKPAYYDVVLTSRELHDADSAAMMDLIFANRVYDMAFYFDLGFYDLFKSIVNENKGSFNSSYSSASRGFDNKIQRLLKKLN